MSDVSSIDKLRGHGNYDTWALDMKACLNRAGFWKVVCGAELPNSVVAQNPADVLAEAQQPAAIPDPQYHERNEAAYDAIILGVENAQKQLIADCKNNGKAAWEKLASLYNNPGRLNLREQLRDTKQRADESAQSYVHRKMELVRRLREIGCPVTDVEAADSILLDLYADWKPWATQLADRGGYSLADVERSLVAEEARRRAAGLLPATNGDIPGLATDSPAASTSTPAKRLSGEFTGGVASAPAKRPRTTSTPRGGSMRKPRSLQQSLNDSTASSPAPNGHPSTPVANNGTRPYQCLFAFSGCPQVFGSKNEWKRHINHIHLQLWFWRCDFPMCANRKGLFNRKDLFGQHLKRMHANEPHAQSIQDRCRKMRRSPPTNNKCGFCGKTFEGTGSWDVCVDHVGEHYASGKGETWELDEGFVEWAVKEGVVVRNEDGSYSNAAPLGSAGGREEEVKEEPRGAPPAPMAPPPPLQQQQQQQEVQ